MTATVPTTDDDKNSIEEMYIEQLRGGARRIEADLEALADALEDGTADAEDVYNVIEALSHTYVDVEDASHTAGAIDAETPAARAANEARKVQYHIATGDDSAAISAATAAAEYAEEARDGGRE
jgi:SpoVK/Ycf46/Vps4 family AAA+-type ATPase